MYLLTKIKDQIGLSNQPVVGYRTHLDAAAAWLLEAQKATPDDGLAHSYNRKTDHWAASYPETTGYAIETLYEYAKRYGKPEVALAARRMADWEIDVQLDDGAVRAGTMDADKVAPTIFNTGQVLFGWARACEEEADNEAYRVALKRASDWLVEAMDDDGAWRKFPSPFGPPKESSYNTRSAYGLVRAFDVLQDQKYLDAAVQNVSYVLGNALPNGFLPDNCLQYPDRPLTHTLAYSMRGLLEVGIAAGREEFVEHARKMAIAIAATQRRDGSIPGRINADWKGVARWVCMTGNAQLALNWYRFALVADDHQFIANADAAVDYVCSLQDLKHPHPGVRGGIKGSHPIFCEYMYDRYPNWAAKFFMDALMYREDVSALASKRSA